MIPMRVVLTVLERDRRMTAFTFEHPSRCTVGRSDECDIRIPPIAMNLDVSRRHCVFEIDPPGVRVVDLGSLNGTVVNGKRIGGRSPASFPWDAHYSKDTDRELHDGDEVCVGSTVIRVSIVEVCVEEDEFLTAPGLLQRR